MLLSSVTLLAAVVGTVTAKKCMNMTVPVTISARNAVYDVLIPSTNLEAITFAQNFTKQGSNFSETILTGYATVSGTYNISTQFCTPNSVANSSSPTVQVLTHGIGFDKT